MENMNVLGLVVRWRLDALAVAAVVLGAMLFVHFRLRRRHACAGVPLRYWVFLAGLLAVGVVMTELAGRYEQDQLRKMLQGIAPTYAQELEKMGHASLTKDTKPDDPRYLAMIDAEIRWEKVNLQVSDIYTFRAGADGVVGFMVDSETDYDRDGQYAGDREQRTAIGEVYPETTDGMRAALKGEASFDGVHSAFHGLGYFLVGKALDFPQRQSHPVFRREAG